MTPKTKLSTIIKYDNKTYDLEEIQGFDLSFKNKFNGENPTFFNSKPSSLASVKAENFIGDISKGGSCNVNIATLDIHCSGTHTECISHIKDVEYKVVDFCPEGFIPSKLISVFPEKSINTTDSYHVPLTTDLVISKELLVQKIKNPIDSLIIRTLPNSSYKSTQNYDKNPAPFFTTEAINYINELSIKHLLVDIPSIDKANDNGLLGNHHSFFIKGKTISELLYIPNSLKDSFGFLQIQIPNWHLDAAPSRPIFYPI
jgi:kynurenine formamidase